MRITRKKYERARAVVADAREQMQLIKQWDEAVKQIERPDRVDALTVNENGSIRFELVQSSPKTENDSVNPTAAKGEAK